ncbi:MAG: hypothetical protein AB7F59_01735 [Bdellovibrionales bacterium]
MKVLKYFLVFMIFFIEIRVKASVAYPKLGEAIQEPLNCLAQQVVCAVSTFDKSKYDLTVGTAHVILGGRTTILRNDADLITLVSGEIWVRTNGHIKIQSEFGSYVLEKAEAWVIKENGKMLVRTVSGEADVLPRGGKELPLPAGFEVWISAVDASGVATSSIPRAIDIRDHMKRWAQLFPGTKAEFKKAVLAFRTVWNESVEKAATFHAEVVQRNIASEQNEALKKKQTLEQIKLENQRLRALFRKKLSLE